ncbi:hypothetical protein GALMADRAFT_146007 [Galerina marginata CBS 339.88]|uniref:Uncharacterized protein n=1 Tax=Galerina marginata (strain CBS 339.88) TaxID=685588 RepID=A0A067SLR3_GALM3|nr:hypothetical protein GALMADRAFT_146007 [Galerina marginata CBS 339.88]
MAYVPPLPYPAVPPGLRNFVHTARARAAARLNPSLILTYGPFTPDTYAADHRLIFGYGNQQIFEEPPMLLTLPDIEDEDEYAPLSSNKLDIVEEITSLIRSELPSDFFFPDDLGDKIWVGLPASKSYLRVLDVPTYQPNQAGPTHPDHVRQAMYASALTDRISFI